MDGTDRNGGSAIGVRVHAHGVMAAEDYAQAIACGSQPRGSEQLRALNTAAIALTRATTPAEVVELAVEAARGIVGTHQGVLGRLHDGTWDGAHYLVSLSSEYEPWRDYNVTPQGLGIVNAVVRDQRPLRLTRDELPAHPEFRGLRDAPGHPPLPDLLAVPLLGREGDSIGLLMLSHKVDETAFDEQDEAMLVQLAQLAAAAIETLEVIAREQRAREHAEALSRVGSAITAQLDLQEVVQIATDAATSLVPAQFGAFFYNTIGEDGEQLMLYTLSGVEREAFSRFPMPRNTKIFDPTFQGTEIVRIEDVLVDERYGKNAPYKGMPPGHLPVRSYLAVPVKSAKDEVVGGLFFGHPEPGRFLDHHEELVVGIADQAAVAIQNARLYEAAQREIRARELAYADRARVAQTLQESLLPPMLPEIPGVELSARYRSGSEAVGGDFYDVYPLGGESWGIILGDVCGKGPEAAAVTALARHTLRTAAMLGSSPGQAIGVLNDVMLRDADVDRFCTVCVLTATVEDGRLQLCFASGGHPPLLILRAGGGEEWIAGGTPLIGVFAGIQARDIQLALAPGDVALLYTDGVTEARRPGATLGEQGLLAAAAPHVHEPLDALTTAIDQAVTDFAAAGARDDLALVALRLAA